MAYPSRLRREIFQIIQLLSVRFVGFLPLRALPFSNLRSLGVQEYYYSCLIRDQFMVIDVQNTP